jgi:prepilin signal peptidase PulO-like enzyme (type II secretory pathway)
MEDGMIWECFLFVLGAIIGGQINRGIYRLAWYKRPIGPWSPPHPDAPPRTWSDRIPICGWLGLRRESTIHGKAFWLRTIVIEIVCAVGCVMLYRWHAAGQLMPWVNPPPAELVRAQFTAHLILISLMLVASFIDIDEKTIPDAITVPGMLLGCALVTAWPACQLPVHVQQTVESLRLTSPLAWPAELNETRGLMLAIACLAGWCYGLLPKTIWTRSGVRKLLVYFFARLRRGPGTKLIVGIFVLGTLAIWLVWSFGQGARWQALLSALLGAAFGGGLIWSVRIVAGYALQREAMGFGDVTLMAMIGAFVGWQSSLIVFFLAPFAGAVVAITQWLLTRRKDIAFGPFLCAAAVVLLVRWPFFWDRWGQMFFLGWLIPVLFAACLFVMGAMLFIWARLTRSRG